MKKKVTKLQLGKETLRTLDLDLERLRAIRGGSPYTDPPSEWCFTTIRCTEWCPILTE